MIDWFRANAAEALNGALVILVAMLVAVGRMFGKRAEPPKVAEIAGAVIDNAAIKPLLETLRDLQAAVKSNTDARKGGDAAILTALHEANSRLEDIKDELIRAPRGR